MLVSAPAIKPEHSTLHASELGSFVKECYGLSDDYVCRFFLRGTNDIYRLQKPGNTLYLRLHRYNSRPQESISQETAFLSKWKQGGLNVATALENKARERVTTIQAPEGVRYLSLFEEAKGRTLGNPSTSQIEVAGATLAKLHKIADGFEHSTDLPRYDLNNCIETSLEIVLTFLKAVSFGEEFSAIYSNLADQLNKAFEEYPMDKLNWGLIHGDFISGNFLFNAEDEITAIDFDRLGYGWRMFEIATYIGHLTVRYKTRNYKTTQSTISSYFINGYSKLGHVTETEIQALPYFYLLRRLWMRSICCRQYVDWSNQFLSTSNWVRDIKRTSRWAQQVCGFSIV